VALDNIQHHQGKPVLYQDKHVIIYSEKALEIYRLKQDALEVKGLPAHAHAVGEIRVQNAFSPKKAKIIAVVYQDEKADFWLVKATSKGVKYCDYILTQTLIELQREGHYFSAIYRENPY
jgi:hypothetical protein